MKTVEREAGIGGVIEALHVERPQFRLNPGMLDVARHAFVACGPMHALLAGDAFSDRLVTGQTLLRGDPAAGRMALQTVPDALE